MRQSPLRVLAVFTTTLFLLACGKEGNTEQPLVMFPHVPSLVPQDLTADLKPWTSGHAIVTSGDDVIAVDQLNNSVVRLDGQTLEVRGTIALSSRPGRVVVGPSATIFATTAAGDVVRITSGSDTVDARVNIGTSADGLALSPDGTVLFAVSPSNKRLAVVDPVDMTVIRSHELFAEPAAVAATRDHVVVTFPFDTVTLRIAQADLLLAQPKLTREAAPTRPLRLGAPADHAMMANRIPRLTPSRSTGAVVGWDGDRVYVSHVQVMTGDSNDLANLARGMEFDDRATPPVPQYYGSEPTTTGGFDFDISFPPPTRPVEPVVTVVSDGVTVPAVARPHVRDSVTGEPLNHKVSDPIDVVIHPSKRLLVMVGEGSDSLLVYSGDIDDPMASPLAEIATGPRPLGVAFSADGRTAYVLHGHDLSVGTVDLSPLFDLKPTARTAVAADPFAGRQLVMPPTGIRVANSVPFADDPRSPAEARGERLFTFARDPRLSRDGHFSCSTCHPGGGEDKLTWVIIDGPRQTPSLQGRLAGTAPFNWNGTRDHLQANMSRTVGRMGGEGLPETALADLETFLVDGLNDVPRNPNVAADGTLTAVQERGRAIFFDAEVGCASCHVGGAGVDGANHNVGTGSDLERDIWRVWSKRGNTDITNPDNFNTPSLEGLWRTAPYLHDGSAPTLPDALEIAWQMGKTAHLTDGDRDALVAYLLTL